MRMDPIGNVSLGYDLIALASGEGVELGDGLIVPPLISASFEVEGGAKVRLEIEVVDAVPRCVSIQLADEGGVLSGDTRLPVQDWVDSIVSATAMRRDHDGTHQARGDAVAARSRLVHPRRRVMSPEFLQQVADAYNERHAISDVKSKLGGSPASLYRWLGLAREAGLIGETD